MAVQSFIELPQDFGRPTRERRWGDPDVGGSGRGWDGKYKSYTDEEKKRGPVEYSVVMMYHVQTRQRKVVVTKGVTVNEAWVRQVMWMCMFEDEDADDYLGTMPGVVEGEDGRGKGWKVKGRKPVGEQMKTDVWNGTTEELDAGDWQEVAAGVSRYELIREALEEFRGDVEGWLTP